MLASYQLLITRHKWSVGCLAKNRNFKVDTKDKQQQNDSIKNNKEQARLEEEGTENEEEQLGELEANEKDDAAAESPWAEGGADEEIADLKDKLLRALADNENTIRRAKREREDTAKYAAANFARDMLTVADNLRRALDAGLAAIASGERCASAPRGCCYRRAGSSRTASGRKRSSSSSSGRGGPGRAA